MDDYTLQEVLDSADKYYWNGEAFDAFRDQTFFRYSPDMRVAVLQGWDKMVAEHHTTPSRATAALISKGRELRAMHELLSRAAASPMLAVEVANARHARKTQRRIYCPAAN